MPGLSKSSFCENVQNVKGIFVQKSRNKKGHSVCSELNISNHVQGHGWTWLDWIELNVFHQEWGSSNEGEPCARH